MNLSGFRQVIAPLIVLVTLAMSSSVTWASIVVDLGLYAMGSKVTVGVLGTGNGLKWNPVGGDWSQGQFSIEWKITQAGSNFTYEYTVKTPEAIPGGGTGAGLSHWILELSPEDADGNSLETYWNSVFLPAMGPSAGDYMGPVVEEVGLTGSQSGNPGMPNVDDGDPGTDADKDDIWGVRFKSQAGGTTVVKFTTPQVPVWGDFYAKDGGGKDDSAVWAHNIGFGTDPAGIDFTNWIPRPNGERDPSGGTGGAATPEAASLMVWSLLMGVVGLVTQRRRQRIIA